MAQHSGEIVGHRQAVHGPTPPSIGEVHDLHREVWDEGRDPAEADAATDALNRSDTLQVVVDEPEAE